MTNGEYLKNRKKKNLLTMVEMLEKRGYTLTELSDKLSTSKPTIKNYINDLKNRGLNIIEIKSTVSMIGLIDNTNVNIVKEDLSKEINEEILKTPPKEFLDKSTNEYIKYLLIKCKFHTLPKSDAVAYVKSRSTASYYDIYTTYEGVRSDYIKNRAYY